MILIEAIVALTVYILIPAPQGVGRRHLDALAGRSVPQGLIGRLMRLPAAAREQFLALGSQEGPVDMGLLKAIGSALGMVVGILTGVAFIPSNLLAAGMLFSIGGYFAPEAIHNHRLAARREEVQREMVFLLANLRSFCRQANLLEALQLSVSGEEGILASEIRWVIEQATMGENLYDALSEVAGRLKVEEFTSLVEALCEAHEVGTPLDQALQAVEEDMYTRWEAEAHEQVAGMDFRLTVIGVALLMPALFMVSMLPAIVQVVRQLVG